MSFLNWRIGYIACSLMYMAVMMYLSVNNFGMVHREYRGVARQLQPSQVEKIALRELVGQCREEAKSPADSRTDGNMSEVTAEDPCLSWPSSVLLERQKTVRERLEKKKRGVIRKLVLFYITFGIFFLLLPPVIIYLVLSVFIWIFKSVK